MDLKVIGGENLTAPSHIVPLFHRIVQDYYNETGAIITEIKSETFDIKDEKIIIEDVRYSFKNKEGKNWIEKTSWK